MCQIQKLKKNPSHCHSASVNRKPFYLQAFPKSLPLIKPYLFLGERGKKHLSQGSRLLRHSWRYSAVGKHKDCPLPSFTLPVSSNWGPELWVSLLTISNCVPAKEEGCRTERDLGGHRFKLHSHIISLPSCLFIYISACLTRRDCRSEEAGRGFKGEWTW